MVEPTAPAAGPGSPPYRLLIDVSQALATTRDLDEVARVLAGACHRHLGTVFAGLALLDTSTQVLTYWHAPGQRASLPNAWAQFPLDAHTPSALVVRTGVAHLLTDADALADEFPDLPDLREGLRERGVRAVVHLPLRGADEVLGTLVLAWGEPLPVGAQDRSVLTTLAWHAAQAVRRAVLVQDERDVARALQEAMLTALPHPDSLQVAARYLPAASSRRVGGDWYDAIVLPSGATALVIGDVTGHDLVAAAAMGEVRSILRGYAVAFGEPPSRVLARLDSAMAQLSLSLPVTAVLAVIEQDEEAASTGAHRVRWSNAGHLPPVLIGPHGRAELLDAPPELLLGVAESAARSDHTRLVPGGSTLLLYTDGLVERRGEDLAAALERLPHQVAALSDLPLDDLLDVLLEEVGVDDGEDDVALLAVRFPSTS